MRTKGAKAIQGMKFHAYSYSATPEWQAALVAAAARKGLSRSEFIRMAVEEWIYPDEWTAKADQDKEE